MAEANTAFYDMKRPGQLDLLTGEIRALIGDAVVLATGDVTETEYRPVDVADPAKASKAHKHAPLYTPLGDARKGLAPRKRLMAYRRIRAGRLVVNLNVLPDDARESLAEMIQEVRDYMPNKPPEPDCYRDYGFRDLRDFCDWAESGIIPADNPLEVILELDKD
jgi:hypothetical protein